MSMRSLKLFCFLILVGSSVLHAEEIDLANFKTDTGECSPAVKNDLQESSLKKFFTDFKTYTTTKTAIDRRKGASPGTGNFIGPLKALMCLYKEGNKMLVTTVDPLDNSCGWVSTDDLTLVRSKETMLGASMSPCGSIKPISVGQFCETIEKFENVSGGSKKLTRFCMLDDVNTSTIDVKFVTDNTTSRLYDDGNQNELIKREIPVFLRSDDTDPYDKITIFSMTQIYDVEQAPDGSIKILLGVDGGLKGWADLSAGHIWYSNLATYFSREGAGKVYLGEIIGSQADQNNEKLLANKPSSSSFDVKQDYVKFPVLFDMRGRPPKAPASFQSQLQIAFIGKFCENEAGGQMCSENDSDYSRALSDLKAADVAFLIDGSKSMRQYFDIVAESLSKFTSDYLGNPSYRFGVAMYGDFKSAQRTNVGDPIDFKVVRQLKPIVSKRVSEVSNAELFIADALRDKAEAVHAGVYEAAMNFNWEPGKPHWIIHIADHGDRITPSQTVYNALKSQNIFYVPIAVEGEGIIKESQDFVTQAELYAKNYKSVLGNPLAFPPIVTYGQNTGAVNPRDKISKALIEATSLRAFIEGGAQKGDILPTLGPAVREIFNIPDVDDIETIAAVGNIAATPNTNEEKDWDYFVVLDPTELSTIKGKSEEVCATLGYGDSGKTASDAILTIVKTLTGDDKPTEELFRQLQEGSIPLQAQTIIGDGMTDFLRRASTGDKIDDYKKEFCRTEILLDGMIKGYRVNNPEDGQGLLWEGEFYTPTNEKQFKWKYQDDLGQDVYYLPLDYLPRPLG